MYATVWPTGLRANTSLQVYTFYTSKELISMCTTVWTTGLRANKSLQVYTITYSILVQCWCQYTLQIGQLY